MYPVLNYPAFDISIEYTGGKPYIFDPVRKKWILLTPEEWVRQHTIRYLSEVLGYPLSHLAVECSLKLNRLSKRADILAYDPHFTPTLLVECKSFNVNLKQQVMEQVSRYNLIFKVPWLLVTNGLVHFGAYVNHHDSTTAFVSSIPPYTKHHT